MRTLADLQRGPSPSESSTLSLPVTRTRTFDTPAFAGMTFHEVETKSVLNRVKGMPFEWSINPYRGCSHACSYCFARPTHTYLNLSPGQDFERQVVVKTNCVEVLTRELARPSWPRAQVAMGTNTDPYQRAEGRYRLMPGIIDALGSSGTPFSVLTKGTLITRDIPVLQTAAQQVSVTAALTVGMLDRQLWRDGEPGTPSPRARLAAVRRLNDAGIPTGVMLAPIMPALNDDAEDIAELVDAAAAAGAVHITPIVLHLRRDVRPVFWPWLEQRHPNLVPLYTRLYARGASVDASYAARIQSHVAAARRRAWRRHPRPPMPPAPDAKGNTAARTEPQPGSPETTSGSSGRDLRHGEPPALHQMSLW